jgi:hypothetical protein
MLNKFARVKNEQIGHAFYHGTFEGKVEVFVRRIEKVRVSAQKEVEREHVAHLLTGVHKNIIRYYDDQKDNEFCTVLSIVVSPILVNFLIISIEFRLYCH